MVDYTYSNKLKANCMRVLAKEAKCVPVKKREQVCRHAIDAQFAAIGRRVHRQTFGKRGRLSRRNTPGRR